MSQKSSLPQPTQFVSRVLTADTAIAVVIAGPDPAIHPVREKVLTKKMDPRVKPAGD
jgi:hypothetical protein